MIRDNTALGRFEMDVDGRTAFVSYRDKSGTIALMHTETPVALRGKGVGTQLARSVFDLLRDRGNKVAVYCDFLADFVAKHPEYNDVLK